MKKLYVLFFTLCFCTNTHAQITFEKTIDTLAGSFANCVHQTFDGGYILCGGSNFGGNDAIVVKTDSLGIIEWAKTYSGPGIEGGVQIEQTPDSGYILNGIYDGGLHTKNWLLKLNAVGDTVWTQTYSINTGKTEVWGMAVNNNGNYGLTGYYESASFHIDAYLIISNNSGIPISSNIYNTIFGSEGHAICKTYNNGYLICGGTGTSPTKNNAYLIRTDSLGDTLWTNTYGFTNADVGSSVIQTSDSGFIVAGYTWNSSILHANILLFKTDSGGNLLWSKTYISSTEATANSVQQTSDGGFIIVGIIGVPPSNAGNIYLIKTDQNGDTLWTKQFGGSGADLGYFGHQTFDDGYIICGSGLIGSNGGIYLIKTNDSGIVVAIPENLEINQSTRFSVYPTPNNGRFYVQLNEKNIRNCTIEIYNSLSQKVFSQTLANDMNTKELSINAPNGIYIVVLKERDKMYSKKIIVQR